MAKFGVIAFDRKGICLAIRDGISAIVIPEQTVGLKAITEIEFCPGCFIHKVLNALFRTFLDEFPAQNTACGTVYHRDQVDPVFFITDKSEQLIHFSGFHLFWHGRSG